MTVDNIAPSVELFGADEVAEGSTHTYTFTVDDPGDDTFTVDATYPKCGAYGTLVPGSLMSRVVAAASSAHSLTGRK